MSDSTNASEIDLEHLRLLSFFFKLTGIVSAVMVSFLLIHLTVFSAMALMPKSFYAKAAGAHPAASQTDTTTAAPQNIKPAPEAPRIIFGGFACVFAVIILLGWTFGALTFYAGHCIKQRKHATFIFIISCLKCVFVPYGTALGVCTIIVLNRSRVKKLFEARAADCMKP